MKATKRSARWRVPGVEGLESRALMAVTFRAYPLLTPSNQSSAAVTGADGTIYFIESGSIPMGGTTYTQAVDALNPTTGVIARYPFTRKAGTAYEALTFDGAGNIWFTDAINNAVGSFDTTTHKVVEYPTPTAASSPVGIATAANGTIWFTELSAGQVGEVDPATHKVVEYPLPSSQNWPIGIVAAPNGGLYITQTIATNLVEDTIVRVDPGTHATASFAPFRGGASYGITAGKDGDLWFGLNPTTGGGNEVASLDPKTGAVTDYALPAEHEALGGFATGSDGTIAFVAVTSFDASIGTVAIGEVTPAHTLSFDPIPNFMGVAAFNQIAAGAGGSLVIRGSGMIVVATPIPAGQAAISGIVDSDPLGDGSLSGGGFAGRTVYVDLNRDGTFDAGDASAVTDVFGYYTITGLAPGAYNVSVVMYPGDVATGAAGPTQSVITSADQLAVAPTFGVLSTRSILPLVLSTAPFGTGNPDVSAAEVNGLYRTILNRAPTAAELGAYVAYLKGGGSLQAAASILLHSDEYEGYLVAIDYANILNHTATPAEVAAWVKVIDQQHLSAEQVAYYFMTSDVFSNAHADGASFISAVYEDVLGRPAAAFEVAAWQSVFASGVSRSAMVDAMIHSTFAAQRAAQELAATFWRTQLSADDEAYVVNYLVNGGTIADQATAFVILPGFVNRAYAAVG